MPGIRPKSPDETSKSSVKAMLAEMTDYRWLLVGIAGPQPAGHNIKAILARIARVTGLSNRRVRSIWHGEVKDLRARELAALLRAARDQEALEEALRERDIFLGRLAACEAAVGLSASDAAGAVGDAPGVGSRSPDRSLAPGA